MDTLCSPTLHMRRPRRRKGLTSGEAGDGLGVGNNLKRKKKSGVERPEEFTEVYVTAQSERGAVTLAPEQIEIKVPNDKVNVMKNIQRKSGARIQLIPLEEGDVSSMERTVCISGDKRQIDRATALIKEAMDQDFTLVVTESNTHTAKDRVRVPKAFTNRLKKENHAIFLMNKKGVTCDARLQWTDIGCFIHSGWSEFCTRNEMQIGDTYGFKLLRNVEKTTFQLCTHRRKKEELSSRFVKLTPTPSFFEHGRQQLPKSFTKANGLLAGRITLVDKDGVSYEMNLHVTRNNGAEYLCFGKSKVWESYCLANEVRAGETIILEFITKRQLRFFSKDDNDAERSGSSAPNLDEHVLASERHSTSEFCSAGPEEEGHSSTQLVPPPRPRETNHFDKDVASTIRTSLTDLCRSLLKTMKRPSPRFKAVRMSNQSKEGCSVVRPRAIEEDCLALMPYPAVSDETTPERTRPAEIHVHDSVRREAQYPPPRFPHLRTDFITLRGVWEAGSYRTEAEPHRAGQGAVSDQEIMEGQDECSLPSPLVGINQAGLSANTEDQNIADAVETDNIIPPLDHEGFAESSPCVVAAPVPSLLNNATAPGQSATQPVPPVFIDPFPHKLEMLQRQSVIRKKWAEAKSLVRAEFKRRSAELNEQFKRKHDDIETEHTSSSCLFSNFQPELEKSQRQSEMEKNYAEEDSLLIAEVQRRSAEVDEEFERKRDDIEAEYTARSSKHR